MKKHCRQCGNDVSTADFYRHPRTADRRARSNLPHLAEARREYQRTAEGKAASARGSQRFIQRNPLKRAAHVAVGNALRDGKLTRQPCEVCGNRAQAHHDDYSKPLEVRWLCPAHHAEWHKHNTPKNGDEAQAA